MSGHRKQVQSFVRSRNKLGNEKLLFHGTNRACLLGESSSNVLLCSLKECYLCSILRASFDVKKCGKDLLDLLESHLTLPRNKERF
jgi:hypothetical protein